MATFRAPDYLRAGGHFGIGTDSNVRIDAGEELRTLEYAQRLLYRARNVLGLDVQRSTGRLLFDAAVAGGTRALGAMTLAEGIETAGLVADASADIVTLSMDHPALASRTGDAIVDSWIFTGGRDVVDCVWRQGRKVVESGRHVERETVAARYRRVMAELMK
jgi:cytosine/adenosine deaminase-related metal-dependent hydrolase